MPAGELTDAVVRHRACDVNLTSLLYRFRGVAVAGCVDVGCRIGRSAATPVVTQCLSNAVQASAIALMHVACVLELTDYETARILGVDALVVQDLHAHRHDRLISGSEAEMRAWQLVVL